MDKMVAHWVERAEYDLETAKAMLDTARYLYVAYMCQQAVEPQQQAHSPQLAAGLASASRKETKSPYGRRFPAACCRVFKNF